jgi:hypothetical protein
MAKKEETKTQGDNLRFYEQLRQVPPYALKQIGAGRLKGMSDINPVYRIKAMTEAFGPCGIGWKYVITKQWLETYGQEVKAFCNIDLFIKVDGEWSDAIPGTGGSSLVAMERSGAYVSDEAYKMALTDALSVAMKSVLSCMVVPFVSIRWREIEASRRRLWCRGWRRCYSSTHSFHERT